MRENIVISEDERLDFVNEKITLIQKKNGLTFGTDAFLLASYIKNAPYARAAELGCGTGIVSLLIAAKGKLGKIYALEIQESFFEITRRNIKNNNFSDCVVPICADIRKVNSSDTEGELDVVFSNPPYMKTDSGKRNEADEKYIARHEVMGGIEDFCTSASRLLKFGGKFYAVWRPDRLCDIICAMKAHNLEPKHMTFVHADAATKPSMVLISATKGARPAIKVSEPLILHNLQKNSSGTRELSERASRIYDTLSFEN